MDHKHCLLDSAPGALVIKNRVTRQGQSIIELKDMLAAALATDPTWKEFREDFVPDRKLVERFRNNARR